MSELTPKERVTKLFKKEPIDVMPVFSGQGMVLIQAIQEMGIRFPQVHTSAEHLASSAIKTAEMFDFDAVIIPYDMCTIPEAMGRGISLYEKSEDILYPTVPYKWDSLDDIQIPNDILERGRMPLVDEAIKIAKAYENGKYAVGGWLLGPFTMAGQVYELDLLLKGLKKDKERIMSFLSDMTDLVIKIAQHYEEVGVDYMSIREMGSGTDLLSPRMWKDLIQPNLARIFSSLKIVEMMNECGADAISVDHKNTMTETRKKIGNDVLLFGDFNPYDTLVTGDVSEVEPVIKKNINDGVDAVWPGCDLWPDAKRENVEVYVQTIREYGKKPSPAVGRI
jgi:[methyl-Co(III) methanol-specific corrinoid protein]:coenzyme M methyltransferase